MTESDFIKEIRDHPIAVLYQAAIPPAVNGVYKPMKPGGYSDSGADIAFNLHAAHVPVITPRDDPDPAVHMDWVFPDTAEGIQRALEKGAEILWINTVLFAGHPLEEIALEGIRLVGQDPQQVHKHDDKWLTNQVLRSYGCPVPPALLLAQKPDHEIFGLASFTETTLQSHGIGLPVVVKPVRGRGSEGVVKIDDFPTLKRVAEELLSETVLANGEQFPKYGDKVIVEEYLPGTELTLTVMPPGEYQIHGEQRTFASHWSLPPVKRFNHLDGIAPYNGVVAVMHNSLLLPEADWHQPAIVSLCRQCDLAAKLVGALAPIRIDCRMSANGIYTLFDLNMKPNMTGAGRPGREDQDSLSCMAARGIGWSYQDLLVNMLYQAWLPTW